MHDGETTSGAHGCVISLDARARHHRDRVIDGAVGALKP
jgi:hypothetical protein